MVREQVCVSELKALCSKYLEVQDDKIFQNMLQIHMSCSKTCLNGALSGIIHIYIYIYIYIYGSVARLMNGDTRSLDDSSHKADYKIQRRNCWFAVEELKLNYYTGEAILTTSYTYYGNLM